MQSLLKNVKFYIDKNSHTIFVYNVLKKFSWDVNYYVVVVGNYNTKLTLTSSRCFSLCSVYFINLFVASSLKSIRLTHTVSVKKVKVECYWYSEAP